METKPLWERLIVPVARATAAHSGSGSTGSSSSATLSLPPNMSLLFDASCGKGELAASYPPAPDHTHLHLPQPPGLLLLHPSSTNAVTIAVPCGYAGGIEAGDYTRRPD